MLYYNLVHYISFRFSGHRRSQVVVRGKRSLIDRGPLMGGPYESLNNIYVCMYVCMYVYIYIYTYIHIEVWGL